MATLSSHHSLVNLYISSVKEHHYYENRSRCNLVKLNKETRGNVQFTLLRYTLNLAFTLESEVVLYIHLFVLKLVVFME